LARHRKPGKGTFSELRLALARAYLPARSRSRMVWLGAGAAAVVLAVVVVSWFLPGHQLLSQGPLSSSHANLESECTACHTPAGAVSDAACSVCHEKYGDKLGVHTFASHYLYRTQDFQRVTPRSDEIPCFACHPEHSGRQAEITRVPDSRCISCHRFGSFNRRHPEFEFAAKDLPDPSGLAFTHIPHVGRVMKQDRLVDVERACLRCHNPEPDGKHFAPISFDRHCDSCHLTAAVRTPWLPVQGDGGGFGVETLEAIQKRGDPGTDWAFFTSPGEFEQRGPAVSKGPLYHRDPWILDNLRRLRRLLYPQAGLADLLAASADAPPSEAPKLYREAIDTLESYALGLRARPEPEIQEEVTRIDGLLKGLRRRLEDPYAPLDETKFVLALGQPSKDLTAAQVEEIGTLVNDLTTPCRECHRVENDTIVRVQADQRTLRRAEFNHRAHILQRRCLDCHTAIPILDHLGATEPVDASLDRAEIQNLPRIATCQQCHNPRLASNRCITCHEFHPNKDRRSDLLLYVGEGKP
jgi:Cytochrome c7 and related cytochrome c/Cytochrome c3